MKHIDDDDLPQGNAGQEDELLALLDRQETPDSGLTQQNPSFPVQSGRGEGEAARRAERPVPALLALASRLGLCLLLLPALGRSFGRPVVAGRHGRGHAVHDGARLSRTVGARRVAACPGQAPLRLRGRRTG